MKKLGVDITGLNSIDNIIRLPTTKADQAAMMTPMLTHKDDGLHTKDAIDYVSSRILDARTADGVRGVLFELKVEFSLGYKGWESGIP